MMNLHKYYKSLIIFFGFFLSVGIVNAQLDFGSKIVFKAGISAYTYNGDLTSEGGGFERFTTGLNLGLKVRTKKNIYPEINFEFGKFLAQSTSPIVKDSIYANTFVDTKFFLADFRLFYHTNLDYPVNLGFGLGLGIINFTPRNSESESLLDFPETRYEDETFSNVALQIPASFNVEISVLPQLILQLGMTHRFIQSDYLDNISRVGYKQGNDNLSSFHLNILYILPENFRVN